MRSELDRQARFEFLSRLRFGPRSVPVALLLLLVVSFGLLIPWLGFYWDDWETILVAKLFPTAEFWDYFPTDRPLAGWTYTVLAPLLGTRPLNWHLATLLLRWLTVSAMWWVFVRVWPGNWRQVTRAALLFAVYPVFIKQPISVAFHQHWLGYGLYFISLAFMLRAHEQSRCYWLLTLFSVGALGLNLAIFEYFAGIELLRPILIWISLKPASLSGRKRWMRTLREWLPYLALLLAFSAWRLWFAAENPEGANSPRLLFDIVSQPIAALAELLKLAGEGTFRVVVSGWLNVLESRFIYPQLRFIFISWGIGAASALVVAVYVARLTQRPEDQDLDSGGWAKQAISVGLVAVILGLLPIWLTGRQALGGLFSDRFALAAMLGASLVWAGVLEWMRHAWRGFAIILGLLIAASVALHLRVGNDYRWSWIDQSRFYWQLYWRAPSITPQTALIAENDIFGYVRPSFSTNLVYLQPQASRELAYWFYSLEDDFQTGLDRLFGGGQIGLRARQFHFSASTDDLLVIHTPASPKCLWILGPEHLDEPGLPYSVSRVMAIADLGRIGPNPTSDSYPPTDIFGPEPDHTWCYYFEKGDLARQLGRWDEVAGLADQARLLGYWPANPLSSSPHEWLLFIEAYGRTGRWGDAEEITLAAFESDSEYRLVLCSLWKQWERKTVSDPEKGQSYEQVRENLQCQ